MLLAQDLDAIQSAGLPGFAPTSVGDLLSVILRNYIFYFAAILLLIYMVVGGFQLMLSRGDPKAVQSAQGKITNGLIGFVIILASYFIVRLIGQIFTIDAIQEIFGGISRTNG